MASGTGVTITDNNDGTYSLSGTATGTATYLYTPSSDLTSLYGTEVGKSYTITSNSDKVMIRVDYSTNGTSWDNGADGQPLVSNAAGGATFTIPASTTGLYIRFRSTASQGSLNGVVLKPMIRPAAITDSTFVPYALPNPTLTPAAIKAVDEGAKNLVQLGFTSTSGSSSVPATTNNNDGTITVNGSRVGNATILVQDLITAKASSVNTRYTLPAGNYVIAPTGNVNIGLQVYKHDGTNLVSLGNARLEALKFTYSDTDKSQYPYICIRLFCEGNVTINNFTFMPMICTAADYAVSPKFVPYCPSLPDIFKWDEYECLYTSSSSVIAKLNTTTSSVKVRINKALRRVVIYFNLVFISDFIYGTDTAFGFGTINSIPNYTSFYPFAMVREQYIAADYTATITKSNENALFAISISSGKISSGTTLDGQFEYTY
jgi:hypothetical protein